MHVELQCEDQVSQNRRAALVRPTLEDAAEEIHVRAVNWLVVEEVMGSELDAGCKLGRYGGLVVCERGRLFLHDESKVRESRS